MTDSDQTRIRMLEQRAADSERERGEIREYIRQEVGNKDNFRSSVMESLQLLTNGQLEMRYDLKTVIKDQGICNARGESHGVRITSLENLTKVVTGVATIIGGLAGWVINSLGRHP